MSNLFPNHKDPVKKAAYHAGKTMQALRLCDGININTAMDSILKPIVQLMQQYDVLTDNDLQLLWKYLDDKQYVYASQLLIDRCW